MNRGIETVLYPVKDIDRAKKMFSRLLNIEPHTDNSYYVGYKMGNMEIGLVPNGFDQGMTGPLCYYTVTDIRESRQLLLDAGGKVVQDIRDVGGGKLIASIQGPEGNVIGLIQMPDGKHA
jgi:predicted enzyme related to lactoylglutathione lyase